MGLNDIKELLFYSLSKETYDNCLDHYIITALIVNDLFGGEIMKCTSSFGIHYYNLINNNIVDLVNEFIPDTFPNYDNSKIIQREYLLNDSDIKNKYEKNLYNLKQVLRQIQGKKFKLINSNGEEYLSDIPGTLGGNKKLKIYGRLDCPSAKRWIEKGYYVSNRVFFENEEVAIEAGYRPCAVCMPEKYKSWKKTKVNK